ncbi:MAG: hypothetical protein HY694_11505 [Deltaproteobacteria bacterium]|nr:hypothetical protein [Deltaproteobacteria bacterium]
MGNDQREWERASVRAKHLCTTLTFDPLPPKEGEETRVCVARRRAIGRGFDHYY